MRFCWTTLKVKDLERSLEFYRGLVGLSVNRRFKPMDHMELAFLGDGSTELELMEDAMAPPSKAEGISIGFVIGGRLEDVMDQFKAAGFDQQSEIHSPSPVMRFFYVKDPDGFSVQLIEDKRAK